MLVEESLPTTMEGILGVCSDDDSDSGDDTEVEQNQQASEK